MKKPFLIIFVVIIILSIVMGIYFSKANQELKKRMLQMKNLQDEELQQTIRDEKERIERDLDEKYRADIISYRAMSARVELQNKKIRELKEKLKKK